MSGKGDARADGQSKDREGKRKVNTLWEKMEANVIPADDKSLL